jgi:glutamate transport system substrate-binding protein
MKNKRYAYPSILSVIAAAGIATASAQVAPTFPAGSSMERLQKAPALRVGVKFDQPLFGARNLSGESQGFDVDIAKLIASKLGIPPSRITWVETSSANREPFLQQGKVDFIIATYAMNDKRKQVINFAGPYILGGENMLVKKGNPLGIKGPEDMAGKKACAINGSEGNAVITQVYKQAQFVPFDVISKCVEALKNGSVDVVVTTDLIEAGLVSKDPANLEMIPKPFTDEPWGIGIPKQDTDLCRFISNVLLDADKDGTYAKLYDATLKTYLNGNGKLPKLDPCP